MSLEAIEMRNRIESRRGSGTAGEFLCCFRRRNNSIELFFATTREGSGSETITILIAMRTLNTLPAKIGSWPHTVRFIIYSNS